MELKLIQTQEEFDKLARQHCEVNNGCNTEECAENWKAGYLYALQQLYEFRQSVVLGGEDTYSSICKIDEKINEYTCLEIISD